MMTILKDPFFYFGFGFIIVHLVSYYNLLDKIAKRIKDKGNEDTNKIKKEMVKKIKPERIIHLHKEVHRIENCYSALETNVSDVFKAGMAIFVLSIIGMSRNFFSIITPDLVNIIIILMATIGASFAINFYKLLKWNLENK